MSQTALGEALGYKTSMISAFETGNRRMKLEDLARICLVLDKEPFLAYRDEREANAFCRPC